MDRAEWFLTAHVVLFALWLGSDLATFSLSRRLVDPAHAARGVIAQALVSIEVVARLCLPAMLGTGIVAANERGWISIAPWSWVVGVGCLLWCAMVWAIHRGRTSLVPVDLVVRSSVAASAWVVGIGSLAGDALLPTGWLGAKMLCFAAIVTCGIAIRYMLRPFNSAFTAIVTTGSTPELEATAAASIRRAQPFVAVIWLALVVAATMAVAQPLV